MSSNAVSEGGDIRIETLEEGPVIRTLTVVVDEARVAQAFEKAYQNLARGAQVKGFRKGKVPRSVLERLYAPSVAEEIERSLVSDTFADAVELAQLAPVSQPDIESTPPEKGGSFTYVCRIEIKPEIELPKLTGLPAQRPAVSVGDEDIDRELETLRERNAPLVDDEEDTPAADGHHVSVDFVGRIDGEAFEGGSGKDVVIELGSGRMIPGFEEQLTGAKAGDDVEVNVTFPDDYQAEHLRGKSAVFACHVASVRKRQVPELDDEFAKDLGEFSSLQELRDRIRKDLLEAAEQEAKTTARRTVMDSLIERTTFDVPPGMVERQLEQQIESMHRQFQGQMPHDVLHAQIDRLREQGRGSAERRVREVLLLEAVAAKQTFEVADADVDTRLDEMAAAQGMDPATLRKMAYDQGWVDAVRSELMDDSALDFLVAEAKVEETTDT